MKTTYRIGNQVRTFRYASGRARVDVVGTLGQVAETLLETAGSLDQQFPVFKGRNSAASKAARRAIVRVRNTCAEEFTRITGLNVQDGISIAYESRGIHPHYRRSVCVFRTGEVPKRKRGSR